MLFIYMYISSIWRNKSWNQNPFFFRRSFCCTKDWRRLCRHSH